MKRDRRYIIAVALLAVLALVFGLAGTVAPLPERISPQQSSSASDSVTHFINPPTFDSDWIEIVDKCGEYFTIMHDLNTTEVLVDIVGRQGLTSGYHKLFFGTILPIQGWNKTYGGWGYEGGYSVVQTNDGGYAIAGSTSSFGAGVDDFWLVKTDINGDMQWNQTYGGPEGEQASSVVQTSDGGYALAGYTSSFGPGLHAIWLVKTNVEQGLSMGLSMTNFTDSTITLYRGRTDPYWNYVRVRIWTIQEPTWQFGDITGPEGIPDGKVDIYDLALVGKNYGKTFSLLSLMGIIGILGIQTYKTRKQPK